LVLFFAKVKLLDCSPQSSHPETGVIGVPLLAIGALFLAVAFCYPDDSKKVCFFLLEIVTFQEYNYIAIKRHHVKLDKVPIRSRNSIMIDKYHLDE
jgi:hypothetical protein